MNKKLAFKDAATITIIFLFTLGFVAKMAGPSFIRLYVETGIGNCKKIPILCMSPTEKIIHPHINRQYLQESIQYKFPRITISIPKGFSVVEEMVKKVYYKKMKRYNSGATFYLLYEEPDFFINLFPHLKKQGVSSDYEFIRRTMSADFNKIKNLTDAFFVIMKGIFIPDLGDEEKIVMAQFIVADKRGFLNYTLGETYNFFDCNIINRKGDFFKIYIKDIGAKLDLDQVFTIIAMVDTTK